MAVVKQQRMLAFILELLIVCSGLFVTDWALSAQDYLGNAYFERGQTTYTAMPGYAACWVVGWPQLQKLQFLSVLISLMLSVHLQDSASKDAHTVFGSESDSQIISSCIVYGKYIAHIKF